MRQLIHFIGMRRSGNHAVINWLQRNAFETPDSGITLHVNDLYSTATDTRKFSRPPDITVNSPTTQDILVLLSYEDMPLATFSVLPTVKNEKSILVGAETKKILLLRDPFNTFASRLLRGRREPTSIQAHQNWEETVALWKSYAREFLGRTRSLGDDVVRINYNLWFADKRYRDNIIMTQFDLTENKDIGIDEVPSFGGGSSMDGMGFKGNASQMQVLARWRALQDYEEFRRLFQDPELVRLSDEIFGHISGTESLYATSASKEVKM